MNIFQLWKKKSFKFSFNNLSSPQKTNVFCFEQYCNSLIFLHLRTDIFFRIFSHIFLKYFWDCCSFSEGKKRKQNKKKRYCIPHGLSCPDLQKSLSPLQYTDLRSTQTLLWNRKKLQGNISIHWFSPLKIFMSKGL